MDDAIDFVSSSKAKVDSAQETVNGVIDDAESAREDLDAAHARVADIVDDVTREVLSAQREALNAKVNEAMACAVF